MTNEDTEAALARLADHAADHNDIPPKCILARDGGPSTDLITYCDRHNLTLDWAVLGEGPTNRNNIKY